jgi:hypothetical protein
MHFLSGCITDQGADVSLMSPSVSLGQDDARHGKKASIMSRINLIDSKKWELNLGTDTRGADAEIYCTYGTNIS